MFKKHQGLRNKKHKKINMISSIEGTPNSHDKNLKRSSLAVAKTLLATSILSGLSGQLINQTHASSFTTPEGLGFLIYTANRTDNSVNVLRATPTPGIPSPGTVPITLSAVNNISGVTSPSKLALSPDGTKAYIVSNTQHKVYVLDIASNTITKTLSLPTGSAPRDVVFTGDATKAYIVNSGTDSVGIIDATTDTLTNTTISVGDFPQRIALNADGSKAYVSVLNDAKISVINTSDNSLSAIPTSPFLPGSISVSPVGNVAYVVLGGASNAIGIIDTTTDTLSSYITQSNPTPNPRQPFSDALDDVVFSPDGTQALATQYSNSFNFTPTGEIHLIDRGLADVFLTTDTDIGAQYIAFSPDGRSAFITNGDINTLRKFDALNAILDSSTTNLNVKADSITTSPMFIVGTYQPFSSTQIEADGFGLNPALGNSINFAGGTLKAQADLSSNKNIRLVNVSGFGAGGTLDPNGHIMTFSGIISGDGPLTIVDSATGGIVTLSGANTYAGGTTVNGGTLIQGAISAFQGAFTLSNGATLDFGNFATTLSSLVANAGSSLLNSTSLTLTGDSTLNADLGVGFLTITGGTTTISTPQSYNGGTSVSGGTLKAGAANTLNATSAHSVNGTLDLNGFNNEIASLGGNGNVTNSGASAATLTMGGNNGSPTFSGAIQDGTSALGLIKTGSGTFTLSGANNTYTGGTTVNGGTFIQGVIGAFQRAFTVSNGATLDFGNFATTLSSLVANAGSSLINNTALTLTGDSTLNADLGGGSLTITGGTTNIGAAQSYTGDTVVSGGTLKAGAANALSASSAHTINATLDLNGFNSTIAALSGNGNLINSGGAPAALTFGSNNASTTFSGTIQDGTSAFGLIKTGSGTFTLSGANNTYTGGTTLSAGELRVDAANALGTGQVALEGGILKFGIDQNVTNTIQVNAASTINNTGKTVTLASGALSGSGDLVFAGTGLFSLSGDNGYAGDATITEGEVKLNGSIAGNFTVNEGATLSGNATIGGNLVNKGTLSPGNSVGKVIVNGNYTADATSVQKFEIDPQGNFDEITVLGNAQLGGKLLIVPAAGTYGTGTKYDFFKVSGTITGNFDSVESTLRLDYIFDTTSNSVSLTINKTSFKDLSKIAGISKNGDLVSFARYLDGVDEKADPNSDIMRVIGKLNQVTEVSKLRKSLLSLSALPTLHQTWSYTALQQGINAITRAQQARTHQNRWMSNLAKEGAKPQLVAQLAEVTSKPAPKFNPKALQNAAMHASDSASVVPVDRNVPMVQHHHNLTLWTTPWAHNYEQDRKKAVAKLKARIRGWAIGADVALSPNLTVGLMGQVARTKDRIGDCLAKDRINTKGTGFYGSWHEKDNGAFLDFAAGINGHRVKGSRRITIVDDHRKAHHKTRARTTDGNMTLGYDFVPATYWQVTPKLSQSLTHINQKHYREHGAGDINLKVRRKKGRMVATELSVDVAKTIKREKYLIRPMVSIGYGHRQMSKKLLRQTASFTGSSGSNFVVKGGRRKQNSLLMAAGLSTSNINGLGFAINAHREHAKKASSYGVTANLLWKY